MKRVKFFDHSAYIICDVVPLKAHQLTLCRLCVMALTMTDDSLGAHCLNSTQEPYRNSKLINNRRQYFYCASNDGRKMHKMENEGILQKIKELRKFIYELINNLSGKSSSIYNLIKSYH